MKEEEKPEVKVEMDRMLALMGKIGFIVTITLADGTVCTGVVSEVGRDADQLRDDYRALAGSRW